MEMHYLIWGIVMFPVGSIGARIIADMFIDFAMPIPTWADPKDYR